MLLTTLAQTPISWGGAAPRMLPEDTVRLVAAFFLALMAGGLMVSLGLIAQIRMRPVDWAARGRALAARPWTWGDGAGVALALATLHLMILLAVRGFGHGPGGIEAGALMVAQTLVFHWAILLLVWVTLVRRRRSAREAFGWDWRRFPRHAALGALFYLGAMPLVLFYTGVYQWTLRWMGYQPQLQDVLRLLMGDNASALRAYFVAVGIVLAPVSEELLFRGIGLPLLIRRIGVWPAVCLLSLFFAALHLHIPSLIPLFLIGAAFSLAYLYTGAIAVPIAMHVIFNAVNIGLMFLLR